MRAYVSCRGYVGILQKCAGVSASAKQGGTADKFLFVLDRFSVGDEFVLQYAAAARDTETALFQPFRKVISFNATLQHTDGLLNESYRELYDLNYQQAQTMLEQDVAELQHKLVQFKKVSLGKLGSFTLNEEAQPVFESCTFPAFCLAARSEERRVGKEC